VRPGPSAASPEARIIQLTGGGSARSELSHFVPPDDPEVSDRMWIDAARVHFRGPVSVGKDLMEL